MRLSRSQRRMHRRRISCHHMGSGRSQAMTGRPAWSTSWLRTQFRFRPGSILSTASESRMSTEVSTRVLELAADIFGETPGELSELTSSDDLESWDSLAQLNLVMAIEDEFSIAIDPDDLGDLRTLGEIVALVRAQLI